MTMRHLPRIFVLLALSVLFIACSSKPSVSLSEQQLGDARNSLKSSDFKAALNNLNGAIKSANNEAIRQQAILLRVALVTAMADADEQMAEAYNLGGRQPLAHANTADFIRARSDYTVNARVHLMDAMQEVMTQRSKLDATPTTIEVPFPGFIGGTDPGLEKIKSGKFISDNERVNTELQLERNCLAQVLAGLAGAAQDLNKGREIYSSGKVEVDQRVYLVVLSDAFLRVGAIFDTRWASDPAKFRTVNQVVRGNLDVAAKLLATKPDKELEARIKKMQADCDKCLKRLGA
jgi:hypothetical protein